MYSQFNKSIVALVMAGVGVVSVITGKAYNIDPTAVASFVGLATTLFVYLVPNKLPKDS